MRRNASQDGNRSREVEFDNPAEYSGLPKLAPVVPRTGLTPECQEHEDELVEVEMSQDLYDHVLEALYTHPSLTKYDDNDNHDAPGELKKLFQNDSKNWEQPLGEEALGRAIEKSLLIMLEPGELKQLTEATVGVGTCSISNFLEWFDMNAEIENVDILTDPYKIALKHMKESNMIAPTSNFRANWDISSAVALGYIAVTLPYRLGFDDNVQLWSFWFWFDLAIDVFFISDLCLNFKTAVLTKDGELLWKKVDVAKAYFRGWFSIDFVSCLPLSYLEYFVKSDAKEASSRNKVVRLLRMFRLLKLLRLVRLKRILDRWEEEMYGNKSLRICKLLFAVMATSHWMCCGWHFVGGAELQIGPSGTEIMGWATEMWGNQTHAEVGYAERYWMSFFWAVMATLMVDTMSAVPQFSCELMEEQIMYVLSFAAGTLVLSVIIGQVSDMIAHANPNEKHISDIISMVHGLMHERRISAVLTRRVRNHFATVYKFRGTTLDLYDDVIALMSPALGEKLATELGFLNNPSNGRRGVMAKVPFFEGLVAGDLILIGCRLQHMKVLMQDSKDGAEESNFIMKQGQRDDRMFIILEGMVRVTRADDDQKIDTDDDQKQQEPDLTQAPQLNLGKLHQLDYFGELAVLLEESPGVAFRRLRSASSITSVCLLYTLRYSDVQHLQALSPAIDTAVQRASDTVRANRAKSLKQVGSDSLFRGGEVGSNGAGREDVGVEERLTRLESKMDQLICLCQHRQGTMK